MRHVSLLLLSACGLLAPPAGVAQEALATSSPAEIEEFPEPEGLRSAVAFWRRVYLEVTTNAGLLHDARRLGVVYEVVRFQPDQSRRSRARAVSARRKHWRQRLERLSGGAEPRDEADRKLLELWEAELGHPPTRGDLRAGSRRIRFQRGQRDKFREGIVRSGAYEDAMRAMFRREGLPEDLAYLPHVESSFNLHAYSKYGAAGLWQFMRSTGRRYLTVSYEVDERLDPMVSTRAATRLLRENYEALGSWPLAITAYNHGRAGMARAKRKLGTDDIATIVERYQSRTFGFASRNFYAQFLAARRIVSSYASYFGPLERDSPEAVDEIKLPFYVDVADLHEHLGVAPETLKHYNPALRRPVFHAGKRLPRGYVLRLPAGTLGPTPEHWLAALPSELRHAEQYHSKYYQVRRGDTLSQIAARQRTSVATLVALNNLPSRHRIYAGQVLQLPEPGGSRPGRRVELVRTAQAAPPPAPKPAPAPAREVRPLDGATPPAPAQDSPYRRVHGDEVIVDADETLGHFAEWLSVPTQRLRDLNGLAYGRPLRMGQRLALDFSRVSPETFIERRMEHHKGIEEDFFGSYRITGTVEHKLRSGESLWDLSHQTYDVPTWLIHRYNPSVDLGHLSPGTSLTIPVTEPI